MSEDHDDLPPPIGRDELPAGEALAPGAPVRLDRVFTRLDRVVAWCDGWISRWLPEAWNPLAQTGCAANFALAVAVVSGVALLFWYSSSVQFAYSSLEAIGGLKLENAEDRLALWLALKAHRVLQTLDTDDEV